MKPIYRCDYCDYIGIEEEVRKHETDCCFNYDRKSCWTCKHRDLKSLMQFKCLLGTEIPQGKIYEFCDKYEWNNKTFGNQNPGDIIKGLFGGF